MRRGDRELTDINDKLAIIEECQECRLALVDGDKPYIVPLNYGYSWQDELLTLYFHSAREGRKLDIISKNNQAAFEVDCAHQLITGPDACDYGYAYKSVIGSGRISLAATDAEKIAGLNSLMRHVTGQTTPFDYRPEMLQRVCVYKLAVDEFTGKEHKIPLPKARA
jgi:nitroimidazol reductase NimA-like FMN-containing flavoprotein (pyridoxamine 5'-phosphate oxidase superfamily)